MTTLRIVCREIDGSTPISYGILFDAKLWMALAEAGVAFEDGVHDSSAIIWVGKSDLAALLLNKEFSAVAIREVSVEPVPNDPKHGRPRYIRTAPTPVPAIFPTSQTLADALEADNLDHLPSYTPDQILRRGRT